MFNITWHIIWQYASSAYLSNDPYRFSSFQASGSSYVSWGIQSLRVDNVSKHLELSLSRNIEMFETCHIVMSGRSLAEPSSCDKPSPYHSKSFEDSNNVVFPSLVPHVFNYHGPLNGNTSELLLATISSPSQVATPAPSSLGFVTLLSVYYVCLR